MSLVALLLVVLIAGLLLGRFGGGAPSSPLPPAQPTPSQTLQRVEKSVEAAGQADQRRLEEAMKGLR